MKKLLLLSALLIFACSSDDGSDNNSNNYKLVANFNYSYTLDNTNLPVQYGNCTYNYDGNKLLNITGSTNDGSFIVNYTYNENNKISGIANVTSGTSGEAEYDNQGRITTWTYTEIYEHSPDNLDVSVANFVYNQDGSVVLTWQENQESYTYLLDQNGNVVSVDNIYHYTYDNKNNPFKNILGNGFFINSWISGLTVLANGLNNNIITENGNIFNYTYDDDNYPISINSPNGTDDISNIQVTITYTN